MLYIYLEKAEFKTQLALVAFVYIIIIKDRYDIQLKVKLKDSMPVEKNIIYRQVIYRNKIKLLM